MSKDDECYCDFPSREFFGCFDMSHAPPCPQASLSLTCTARACEELASGFNDDGNALCEDCLLEWMIASQDDEVEL